MSDNPSRLELLQFTRRVVEQQARASLRQLDRWIADEERRQAEHRQAEERRPPPPEWLIERGLDRTSLVAVHTGDCWDPGKHLMPATREQARDAIRQAAVLACEVITRLMAGCRAVACSPGITDLSSHRLTARAEWDRVNAKIAQGWESLGFRPYRDNVYLLSPASQDLEEQRGALRQHLADLGRLWRTDASRSVSLADEAGSPENL